MSKRFSILLVLVAIQTIFSSEVHLYVAQDVDESILSQLIQKYSVRGHYEDTIVLVEDSNLVLSNLKVNDLGIFNATSHYVILEHQEIDFPSEFASQKAWNVQVLNVLQEFKGNMLYSTAKRMLVHFEKTNDIFNSLPINTAYLPLLDESMVPPPQSPKLFARLEAVRNLNDPDPQVQKIVDLVSAESAETFLNYLTGVSSEIKSRNSIHPDVFKAADYLEKTYEAYGFNAEQITFNQGWGPNVIATLPGIDQSQVVIVGAHYDSRGAARSSATADAPGANDDGSGTSMLLQFARIIHELGMTFKYTLILGSWGGEEQGLVGSKAYAASIKKEGVAVLAMFQADMIAYRKSGESLQCGFPTRYHTQILTDLAMEIMKTYTPEVQLCTTSACCSDHQSFYEQGYSATQFFERCGSIADDKYHNVGDIVNRNGFEIENQLIPLTKGIIAVASTVAEPME